MWAKFVVGSLREVFLRVLWFSPQEFLTMIPKKTKRRDNNEKYVLTLT